MPDTAPQLDHEHHYQRILNALPVPPREDQYTMTPRAGRARVVWERDGVERVPVVVDAYRFDGGAWLCHLRDVRPWVAGVWLADGDVEVAH